MAGDESPEMELKRVAGAIAAAYVIKSTSDLPADGGRGHDMELLAGRVPDLMHLCECGYSAVENQGRTSSRLGLKNHPDVNGRKRSEAMAASFHLGSILG